MTEIVRGAVIARLNFAEEEERLEAEYRAKNKRSGGGNPDEKRPARGLGMEFADRRHPAPAAPSPPPPAKSETTAVPPINLARLARFIAEGNDARERGQRRAAVDEMLAMSYDDKETREAVAAEIEKRVAAAQPEKDANADSFLRSFLPPKLDFKL